ncbi:hypothetical protein CYMTET_44875 [Cymbomonas tetramitiformis]|uniref:Uncharacterized protein n=1 Tax=Cymbomonas tetramitiformis TaxID=36881 RepID=A0AAE0BZC9_9CHLO|nr:hypothetical protein CYMTET_44875 [Cymbomonas tetramitiformis]
MVDTFTLGRTFTENKGAINSLDFHRVSDLLVTSGDDDSIRLYDTSRGTLIKTLYAKQCGVGCVVFTHHQNAVICASKHEEYPDDDSIRYLSLYDNRYLRGFKGHMGPVTSLCMNPKDDTFVSSCQDNTVRFWDLRAVSCQAMINTDCSHSPYAAFDEQGLVLAVSAADGLIKLYDVRSYDKGPFVTFPTVMGLNREPLRLDFFKFSNDGKTMLATGSQALCVLDAYLGSVKHLLKLTPSSKRSSSAVRYEVACSADGKYAVAGGGDGVIRTWSNSTGEHVASWRGLAGATPLVKWAPNANLVASAGTDGILSLWIGASYL